MFPIGSITFFEPLAFLGAPLIGLAFWFFWLQPTKQKQLEFSTTLFLDKLKQEKENPVSIPIWHLILRASLLCLIILAASQPIINAKGHFLNKGPVYLIIDDDWAAAKNWNAVKKMALGLISQAKRQDRLIGLVTTAKNKSELKSLSFNFITPDSAETLIAELQPKPWFASRVATIKKLKLLDNVRKSAFGNVFWLSNGIGELQKIKEALVELKKLGSVKVFSSSRDRLPLLIKSAIIKEKEVSVELKRLIDKGNLDISLILLDKNGDLIMRSKVVFKDKEREVKVNVNLPSELLNEVSRIEIQDNLTVGGMYLFDERQSKRTVVIVSGDDSDGKAPLLSGSYYLKKALEPYAYIKNGDLDKLQMNNFSILTLIDTLPMTHEKGVKVEEWVREGGVLLRFLGPRTSQITEKDKVVLLPVKLQEGDRVLGGPLSWKKSVSIAPFLENSIFSGLKTQDEIKIYRQVLASPSFGLTKKTWAQLIDGSPLITAKQVGKGWSILFHCTANTEWSNLPISGLFVEMLRRILKLSSGFLPINNEAKLTPTLVLDGFGKLTPPNSIIVNIKGKEMKSIRVSKFNPPGFYIYQDTRYALNLEASPKDFEPIITVSEHAEFDSYERENEYHLTSYLVVLIFVLFFIDSSASLFLRREISSYKGLLSLSLLLFCVTSFFVRDLYANDDSFALKNSLETRLAYVVTGDQLVDEVSRLGLSGLNAVLFRRTAVDLGAPHGVNIEVDDLSFFPLIYWPVLRNSYVDTQKVRSRVLRYINNGGMLFFDIQNQTYVNRGEAGELKKIANDLNLPTLIPVPHDHVLTRSFYLLKSFPGRSIGGQLWIDLGTTPSNDNISSVIVGMNNWAGAWAIGKLGKPLFQLFPGGENQRELAYRFGVNLVMYALTGNYKMDQVHLPSILKRLGR